MDIEDYKEAPYAIYMDSKTGTVWIISYLTQEKFVLTEKDFNSIDNAFRIIKTKKKGLL